MFTLPIQLVGIIFMDWFGIGKITSTIKWRRIKQCLNQFFWQLTISIFIILGGVVGLGCWWIIIQYISMLDMVFLSVNIVLLNVLIMNNLRMLLLDWLRSLQNCIEDSSKSLMEMCFLRKSQLLLWRKNNGKLYFGIFSR